MSGEDGVMDGLMLIGTLHRVGQIADAAFADAAGDTMTARQMQVLVAIADAEPANQGQICAIAGIDGSTVSVMCRILAGKGWIVRRRGKDARARVVTLTEAGRSVIARAAATIRRSIVGVDKLRISQELVSFPAKQSSLQRGRRTARQMQVLAAVAANPRLSQTQLCDLVDMHASTASVICDKLAAQGLIVRRRGGRANRIILTSKGSALVSCA